MLTPSGRALLLNATLLLSTGSLYGCSSDDPKPAAASGGSTATGAGTGGGGSSSSGSGGSASGGSGSGAGGSGGKISSGGGSNPDFAPSPIISRGKNVESPQGDGSKAFDGDYTIGSAWNSPTAAADGALADTWVKVELGEGPSRLLLVWHHIATPDYTIAPGINFGAPTGYRIEVSPTGEDGSFTTAVEVTPDAERVSYRSRAHSFDFEGMSFVRLTLTDLESDQPTPHASLTEVDIHDISAGAGDTYLVAGHAMTRFAYDGHVAPLFPELINQAHPAYYPALIDIADLNGQSEFLLSKVDEWLEVNPDFHYWILVFGMGDAEGNLTPEQRNFESNMQGAIDKLKAAGKVPLIPRVQKTNDANHEHIAEYNAIIDRLVTDNDLPPAPDLYSWFEQHPEQLCTTGCESQEHVGVDPTDEGFKAINSLWAAALDPLYAP